MPTDAKLDIPALRALMAKASVGEWYRDENNCIFAGSYETQIVETDSGVYSPSDDDAQYIVALVNAAPQLLDELEALRMLAGRVAEFSQDPLVAADARTELGRFAAAGGEEE